MMGKSRLQIARSDILRYFDELPKNILLVKDISRCLSEQRAFWRLAQSTSAKAFIKFLLSTGKLSQIIFPFAKPYKQLTRYVWGDVPLHQVILTLHAHSYFSHYTAMKFHGLTEQLPKTIYLNHEQFSTGVSTGVMSQESINAAFRRRVRVTNCVAETDSFRLCVLNGRNTGELGVIEDDVSDDAGKSLGRLRYTNLERTLIDITVRPVYAGGIFEVAKAYQLAKESLSVNRLAAMLQKLHFTYPYHQAVGFYLQRAGYKPAQLDLLRRFPIEFDFYLAHDMGPTEYNKDWKLFVPKSFQALT